MMKSRNPEAPHLFEMHLLARPMRRAFLLLASFWIGTSSANEPPLVLIEAAAMNESLFAQGATSSSSRILGISSLDIRDRIEVPEFVVFGLSKDDKTICVKVRHVNNLYQAEFNFTPPPGSPSALRVRFPSRYWNALGEKKGGLLSISAQSSANADCVGDDAMLPTAWGVRGAQPDGVLLVNGGQSTTVRIQVGRELAEECSNLKSAMADRNLVAVAYTHVCRLSKPRSNCPRFLKVVIQRSNGPSLFEPDRVDIQNFCAKDARG
jgi:hypothetical protein